MGTTHLIRDIICLEKVQHWTTKFILSNISIDHKTRLKSLCMYWLELQDIMVLIKCLKNPSDNFDVSNHITFMNSCTKASGLNHLQRNFRLSTTVCYFYFNRTVSLWNSLVSYTRNDLTLSIPNIKQNILTILWDHFLSNFDPDNPCTFHCICPCFSCCIISHL